jgi:hypothetical protein
MLDFIPFRVVPEALIEDVEDLEGEGEREQAGTGGHLLQTLVAEVLDPLQAVVRQGDTEAGRGEG